MKILVFADLHTPCIQKIRNIDFNKYNYDVCFTLGDIDFETLNEIQKNIKGDIYAVLGNHDTLNILDGLNIQNIDRKRIE